MGYQLQILQTPVPVLDLHRTTYVHLDPNQSFKCAIRNVVVNGGAHQVSVHIVHQDIPPNYEVNRIPIIRDQGGEILVFSQSGNDCRRAYTGHVGYLSTHSEK